MAPSLLGKIARLATSPQGKRAFNQAKDFAAKPENRAKIEQARQKLVERAGRGRSGPDAPAPPEPDAPKR
ncbi:MAG: hypothetical protein ABI181_15460 [Mycobacteriaceae bacterium]